LCIEEIPNFILAVNHLDGGGYKKSKTKMSIDLNKPSEGGNTSFGGQSSNHNYNDPNSSAEVREIFRFAYECKQKNMPDYQIEQSLQNKGLDALQAATVMRIVNQAYQSRQQSDAGNNVPDNTGGGGGRVPRILIYIGILIGINVLSAIFGWGFWIY
jgi:hypothetical protein